MKNKKKQWKQIGASILVLLFAVCSFGSVTAYADGEGGWPAGPEVGSESAIVMEANTGTVLYEKNADQQHYPASITKILTTLLAIENSSMDDIVTFSAKAVYENEGGTSHIARDLDEQMTMEQCLYAVMLESANECAYAVAEHVGGGDAQTFIDMMNAKAAELGCTNSHFNNPNGLPDETHVTTCRDMALIAKAAIQNSTFRQITGTAKYTIPPTNKHETETPLNNHHRMISAYKGAGNLYEYCIGGKTGYTVAAGNTLVTYAEKDGMLLICVVMNAGSTQYSDTRTLFDYCFSNYKMYNVAESETRYDNAQSVSVSLFAEVEPFAKLDADAEILLPVSADFNDTEITMNHDRDSDTVLGTLVYSYAGKTVGSADVVTTGADAMTYEFGEKISSSDDSLSASEDQSAADTKDASQGKKEISKDQIVKIVVILAVIAAAIFGGRYLYNNIHRHIRKKNRRDRRYKTIHKNRKWDRHSWKKKK